MKHIIFRIFLALVICYTCSFCAQPGNPTGGPQDKEGPQIVDTFPLPRTLNFQGDEVVLKFNEFVKLPTYGKEIFISPFMANQPVIKMSGKKVKIQFQEVLSPRTTYVISFIDVPDQNAGNKMDQPFTLAFSTGAIIDSMEVQGKVIGKPGGKKGDVDFTIMLFEADSIEGNDFLGKRPAYLTKTDKNGDFKLSYLRNIPYRLYGITDIDRSNTYSLSTEPLALAANAEIVFTDSFTGQGIELFSFTPDTKAPAVRDFNWLSDSVLLVEFTRGLRADSLAVSISDTLGQDSVSVDVLSYDKQQLILLSHRKREQDNVLHLQGMVDSLGRAADSSLVLRAKRVEEPDLYPLFTKIEIDPKKQAYNMMLPIPLNDISLRNISLRDTGDRPLAITYERDGFELWVKPDTAMVAELFYFLWLEGGLFGEEDTTFKYKVAPWEPETYGSLAGSIQIKDYEGSFVAYFAGPQNFSVTDTVFSFSYLPAGDYQLSLLLEEDASGSWTPGSLEPYKLPERIIELSTPISIRANWTIEDQVIEFQTKLVVPDSLKTN